MTRPWTIARYLPFRFRRLYWRIRLQWRGRQLIRMQRQNQAVQETVKELQARCDRLLARNQEMLAILERARARLE
jgi:hypothetical protein